MREFLKVILLCMAAAIFYGIIHDQFTARICLEYFTVFHPTVFTTASPTLLGIGWGILATWWVGAILGLLLAIAARVGSLPPLTAARLLHPIGKLLLLMAVCATLSGVAGFVLAKHQSVSPPEWMAFRLSRSAQTRFMADWWAHTASYLSGFVGGIGLCVLTYRRRETDRVRPMDQRH
jgi:hypothetical protein